jgi:aminoglycoside phosphotransferase (APT) family kinase protein
MDEDQAIEVIRGLLSVSPQNVSRYIPEVGGNDSYSFRFRAEGEALLLKVKRSVSSPIGVYFYRRLKAAGVPVPGLVAFSPTAGPQGEACVIWSWVDGRPAHWNPGEICPYDEAVFGELLRQIHDLSYEGDYGLLGDDPNRRTFSPLPDLGPTSRAWLDFFHFDGAARRYAEMGYLSPQEADLLSNLPGWMPFWETPKRLLHMGDIMHHGNMIIGPGGGITAIVDYVESMVGDPRYELAFLDYYFSQYPFARPAFDMSRFREGYGTDHDPEDDAGRFYLLSILLFEKLLFYRPDTPRGQWGIGKVKELLKSYT